MPRPSPLHPADAPPQAGRRRLLRGLLASPALLHLGHAGAESAQALPAPVLQALAQAGIPPDACSIEMQWLDQARPVYSHLAAVPRCPASVLKLVPTYAALSILGPAYRWQTPVYALGPLRDGVLHAGLGFVGSGDPHLMAEDLWHLALRLRGLGVRRIAGPVLIDRSAFALPRHDPGAFDGDALAAYNVGPDAFLLNFGVQRLSFEARGGRVRVISDPPLAGWKPQHPPRTGLGPCGRWESDLGADFARPLQPNFSGTYARACGEQTWNVALPLAPDAYAGALLRAVFAQAGIVWRHDAVSGPLPAGAALLTSWQSAELAPLLRVMAKYSNNVMCQQVFLTLGLHAFGPGSNFERAAQAAAQALAADGVPMPDLVLDNGCGLSRQARVTADGLTALLRAAWSATWMPEFLAALPLSGEDGTLRERFTDARLRGRLHAKTGSIDQARGLAGYLQAGNGRRASVVAIVNHPRAELVWPAWEALMLSALNQG